MSPTELGAIDHEVWSDGALDADPAKKLLAHIDDLEKENGVLMYELAFHPQRVPATAADVLLELTSRMEAAQGDVVDHLIDLGCPLAAEELRMTNIEQIDAEYIVKCAAEELLYRDAPIVMMVGLDDPADAPWSCPGCGTDDGTFRLAIGLCYACAVEAQYDGPGR